MFTLFLAFAISQESQAVTPAQKQEEQPKFFDKEKQAKDDLKKKVDPYIKAISKIVSDNADISDGLNTTKIMEEFDEKVNQKIDEFAEKIKKDGKEIKHKAKKELKRFGKKLGKKAKKAFKDILKDN